MYVGTTGVLIGDQEVTWIQKMTSYDPMNLQALLARGRQEWCKYAILEVSSHGLHQWRFKGIKFQIGVLTNVTAEHLDYHKTYLNYKLAKKKLFDYVAERWGDDKQVFLPTHQEDISDWWIEYKWFCTWFGFDWGELWADNIVLDKEHTTFDIVARDEKLPVYLPMVGKFNILNTLVALGVVMHLGADVNAAIDSLQQFWWVEWRQQQFLLAGVDRYIDFAHTPQWLDGMLSYLNSVKWEGKLWCLFGAPGMRDPFKRPEMWKVVDQLADIMIVTDDDADTEDRYQIIDHIKAWVSREEGDTYQIIPDRRAAIQYVVDHVSPGDVVLLAGKWHEKVLVTNEWKIPRSDAWVLHECLWIAFAHD